jgi:hypothetical protein
LFDVFGNDGKYIFIIRNIEDVASSFNVRAQNPKDKWPAVNDYKKAVEIWNESLKRALKAVNEGAGIFIVSYEELFDSEIFDTSKLLLKMIDYLGVDINSTVTEKHIKMCSDYLLKVKPKEKVVLEGQVEFINANADIKLFEKLKEL